jgi:hypothetical protein
MKWYSKSVRTFITSIGQILTETGLLLSYPVIGILNLFWKSKPLAISKNSGKTIIIVERWLQANILHQHIRQYLESKGFQVHLVSHSIKEGTFDDSAKKLKQFIDAKKLNNVTLVGISSGGISALLYLQELNGWEKVQNFISIGTPFYGTILALPLGLNKSCREILPGSRVVKKIKRMQLLNLDRIKCLVARFDELVPRSSSTLPGAQIQTINVLGHNALHLTCKETYDTIASSAL